MVCPVCKNIETNVFFENKETGEGLRIINCCKCNSSFLEGEFNQDNYIEDISKVESTDGLSYDWRLETIKKYRKLNRVLDFGCGVGGFLQEAKKDNWICYGLEKSDKFRKHVNSLGIECFSPEENIDKEFDAIVLWGVLEHLDNPRDIINGLSKHLRKGGVMLLLIPKYPNLFFNIAHFFYYLTFKKVDWFLRKVYPEQHRMYFDIKELENIFKSNMMEISYIKEINVDIDTIIKSYENQNWGYGFKLMLKMLNKLSKTHYQIVVEKNG